MKFDTEIQVKAIENWEIGNKVCLVIRLWERSGNLI